MNNTEHTHGGPLLHNRSHMHESSNNKVPLWVRYYDIVTNLVTFGRTGAVHKQTLALAGLRSGDAVLDIGCGTGKLLLEAEKIVGRKGVAVGLDVEPEMIRQARNHAGKRNSSAAFDIASVEQIPYSSDSFDVVFSTLMYHHLSERGKEAGLAEVARVLKPGGRFLLVDINPSRRSILTSLPGHSQVERQDFVRGEVTGRMEAAGLTVIDSGAHPSRQLSYAIGQKAK